MKATIWNGAVERWLPVVGFDDYEVSDLGRVRSIERVRTYIQSFPSGKTAEVARPYPACVLRPGTAKSGHQIVVLGRNNTRLVHALVLQAFVGPRPVGADSLHGDGNPANNHLDNLRWGTRKENVADTFRHGRGVIGEMHPFARLKAADIPVIREALKTTQAAVIAAEYGVSRGCIQMIETGRSWKHIASEAA